MIFIDYLNKLRDLPYGEDGKYVHMVLGIIAVGIVVIISMALGSLGLNFVGLSLFAMEAGIGIEIIQRVFLNGKNTLKESIFDSIWTCIGGSSLAYLLYNLEYVSLYYSI